MTSFQVQCLQCLFLHKPGEEPVPCDVLLEGIHHATCPKCQGSQRPEATPTKAFIERIACAADTPTIIFEGAD